MQERHLNKKQYFDELAITSSKYLIPYINQFVKINSEVKVLEIGCGDCGNLYPFAQMGCKITGIDIDADKIEHAKEYFKEKNIEAELMVSNIFSVDKLEEEYDLIITKDVIEHISDKEKFLELFKNFLKPNGYIFVEFPCWQMPFGGHQQACKNKVLSRIPFIHLLPKSIYKAFLNLAGEDKETVDEMLDIKECGITIEKFDKLANKLNFEVIDKKYFFINPHYEVKFKLKPIVLSSFLSKIPYFRNYYTTACFYLLRNRN